MTRIDITVFTPTYNRASLIGRVFDSLTAQTTKNFEWLIIDDGSKDNTFEVIEEFRQRADFPIRFHAKENAGKAAAINDALDLACGEWFVVFDSDDWCDPSAMGKLMEESDRLVSMGQYDAYCAISVLKRYQSGNIVGDDYSRLSKYGLSYVDRFNRGVKGDKWEFIRTTIHRQHRYRLFPGDRYMAPSYAWILMGAAYKTVFINATLSTIQYQADGISRNNLTHRVLSARTVARYYKDVLPCAQSRWLRLRTAINFHRFSWHAGAARDEAVGVSKIIGWIAFRRDRALMAKWLKRNCQPHVQSTRQI